MENKIDAVAVLRDEMTAAIDRAYKALAATERASTVAKDTAGEVAWEKLTDESQMNFGRLVDVVLNNGVTEYCRRCNQVDWTQVQDWRYAAPISEDTELAALRTDIGLAKLTIEQLKTRLAQADAHIETLTVSEGTGTLECPTCGVDRLKEPCPGMADECAMVADAHLLQPATPSGCIGDALPTLPEGLFRLETVQYWATEFAKNPHQLAGGMIVKLLQEYAQLRTVLADRAARKGTAGTIEALELCATWIEHITPEQLDLWRLAKVDEIRQAIRAARTVNGSIGDSPLDGYQHDSHTAEHINNVLGKASGSIGEDAEFWRMVKRYGYWTDKIFANPNQVAEARVELVTYIDTIIQGAKQ